jgi:predicted anti-sigma-YlaC factor YlaD
MTTHVGADVPALIDCRTAGRALYDYLDGRLPHLSNAEVQQHLEVCAACAHHFTFARRLLELIPSSFPVESDAPLIRRRIVDALQAEGFVVSADT